MFKKSLFILCTLALVAVLLQGCKNQCDSCPGIVKQKKVRKSSKGSI
jgi:hypothetical protein